MDAIVKKAFRGVPDGETQVRDFAVKDIITGDLAEVAVREKWAVKKGRKKAKPVDGSESAGQTDPDNPAKTQSEDT